jgi:hypothetical protein
MVDTKCGIYPSNFNALPIEKSETSKDPNKKEFQTKPESTSRVEKVEKAIQMSSRAKPVVERKKKEHSLSNPFNKESLDKMFDK